MKYFKFVFLFLLIIGYVLGSYVIFSGEEQEIFTNQPIASEGGSEGGTVQPLGVSDSIVVTVTHMVKFDKYWGFIKIPVRRGDLNLSVHGFWFFNIIVPILFFVCIIQEIYNWGKIQEVKG